MNSNFDATHEHRELISCEKYLRHEQNQNTFDNGESTSHNLAKTSLQNAVV